MSFYDDQVGFLGKNSFNFRNFCHSIVEVNYFELFWNWENVRKFCEQLGKNKGFKIEIV